MAVPCQIVGETKKLDDLLRRQRMKEARTRLVFDDERLKKEATQTKKRRWVEEQESEKQREHKRLQHLLALLQHEQAQEVVREISLQQPGLSSNDVQHRRLELARERGEVADRIMRILQDYNFISGSHMTDYLQTALKAISNASHIIANKKDNPNPTLQHKSIHGYDHSFDAFLKRKHSSNQREMSIHASNAFNKLNVLLPSFDVVEKDTMKTDTKESSIHLDNHKTTKLNTKELLSKINTIAIHGLSKKESIKSTINYTKKGTDINGVKGRVRLYKSWKEGNTIKNNVNLLWNSNIDDYDNNSNHHNSIKNYSINNTNGTIDYNHKNDYDIDGTHQYHPSKNLVRNDNTTDENNNSTATNQNATTIKNITTTNITNPTKQNNSTDTENNTNFDDTRHMIQKPTGAEGSTFGMLKSYYETSFSQKNTKLLTDHQRLVRVRVKEALKEERAYKKKKKKARANKSTNRQSSMLPELREMAKTPLTKSYVGEKLYHQLSHKKAKNKVHENLAVENQTNSKQAAHGPPTSFLFSRALSKFT